MQCAVWNTQARIEMQSSNTLNSAYNFDVKGTATDQGLINFLMDISSPRECYDKQQSLTDSQKLLEIPFNSTIKKSILAVRIPENAGTDKEVRIFCNGAAEMVLALCSSYVD